MKINFKNILYWLYDTSGFRFIVEKQFTAFDPNTDKRKPKTLFLWIVGIYIALFGVASQRYENRIDIIENRANSIFAQLCTSVSTEALSRIPYVQNMKCPIKPDPFRPRITFSSLFKETYYTEMVNQLNDTIELWKRELRFINLSNANLSGLDLSGASLEYANLSETNLTGCILSECNFNGANLRNANFSNCNLQRSRIYGADITGADFTEADLLGINLNLEDLLNVKSLYNAKLDTIHIEYIQNNKPQLLKEIITE